MALKTTPTQNNLLGRLYREGISMIHDGNKKKTARSLAKKGLVEIEVVPMSRSENCRHFFFRLDLTRTGTHYVRNHPDFEISSRSFS